ncbi:hypothetical protein [Amycolatopsis kentuckyensis]|uniref:hypothetical protein n=1 Tax=Amycolatopsis kentuckyensis TaxID=218823 RepID=UPI000A3C2141|nr:hypothetical protein [Amycolatopsis kentuckyensis]
MTAREELGLALWRTQTLRGLADCTSPTTRDRFVGELLALGWRPPLPKSARVSLRAVVAGAIGEHTGEEEDHEVAANYAAAQALIDRGWLDPVGEIGPPEPVATTLRRIIRDLEDQAAGPQRHTHAGIALSQYADRLRGHPALDGDADAGWPPLPDSETAEEMAILRARLALSPVQVEAMEQEIAELKQEHGVLSGQLHAIRTVLAEAGHWTSTTTPAAGDAKTLQRIRAVLDRPEVQP